MKRRILHVTPGLVRGGIEVWLMHVLRTVDRAQYPMDFLAVLGDSGVPDGAFEEEFRALGSRVISCRGSRQPWTFARDFAGVMRRHGPYDVVHAHLHHYSGFVLRLAAAHRVPVRIAHSHSDTRTVEAGTPWHRRAYLLAMKRWIRRCSTYRIAVSRSAAEDLFGPSWKSDPRCETIPCGLDFSDFAVPHDRGHVRVALGLPEDALVIGHVGLFYRAKNHSFVLDVATEAFRREHRARLVLVGDGPLRPEIATRADALGISDRVVFAGARDDVAALMRAMDAFVFPSHHEGLGLVLLEAQAAGLPCVLSDALPEEVDVIPSLIHRLSLSAPPAAWAEVLLRAAKAPPVSPAAAHRVMSESDFAIQKSVERLLCVYNTGT